MRRLFLMTGLAVYFAFSVNVFADVELGDTTTAVEQAKGAPMSQSSLGKAATWQYKDGTKITFTDGVVTDITIPGRITIGSTTKVFARQPPTPPRATNSTTANKSATTNKVAAATAVAKGGTNATPATVADASEETKPAAQTKKAKTSKQASVSHTASPLPPVAVTHSPVIAKQAVKISKIVVAGIILFTLVVSAVFHVFFSYCFKLICQKAGHEPGVVIWIPIAQCIPLQRVAKMADMFLLLLFVPMVNCGYLLFLWARICKARNKSPWLAATLLVPGVNLFLIPYLAFTPANVDLAKTDSSDTTQTENESAQTDDQNSEPSGEREAAPERVVLS